MTTSPQEETMPRQTFSQELIQGLFKCRNKRPELRPWLRQCIELERRKRSR